MGESGRAYRVWLGRPMRRWEKSIRIIKEKWIGRVQFRFIWFRIRTRGGFF
jgi:hypothetical protein